MCTISLPEGSALPQTRDVVMRVSEGVRALPVVEHVLSLSGYDLVNSTLDDSSGTLFIKLEPWDVREKMGIDLEETLSTSMLSAFVNPEGWCFPSILLPSWE